MTKRELIDLISESNLFETKKKTEECLNLILDTIKETLSNGECVDLHAFGKFETVVRAEKNGRNPSTGEAILIPSTKAVKFKSSKALKDIVNK